MSWHPVVPAAGVEDEVVEPATGRRFPWPLLFLVAGTVASVVVHEGRVAWWQWPVLVVVFALLLGVAVLPARLTR